MAVRRAQGARPRLRSQHFLRSSALAAELVGLAGVRRSDLVLEVGAGFGMITAQLARRAGYVVAFEIDPGLAARLRERFGRESGVLIVEGDVFRQPIPRMPFRVVSNVPFDSTTRLLRLLLADPRTPLERAALIVQWEVARKRAQADNLLGLSWAPWWRFRLVRRVPADSFRPRPSVDAGIVVVSRRAEPLLPASEVQAFRSFVRRRFGHGRHQLSIEEWVAAYQRRSKSSSHRVRRD